jgi:recombinational DNA repair ATPase RecF
MWVEELSIENIRCFKSATLRFASGDARYPWVTFLSENGGGKTTALQALGLLLAGPEGAQKPVNPLRGTTTNRRAVPGTRPYGSEGGGAR